MKKRGGARLGYERATTAKATVNPTINQLSWAAGFIEGEGCFAKSNNSLTVSAVQRQREPLERLLALFGGNLSEQEKLGRPMYRWRVSGSRARGVAYTLYSWLSPRRRQQVQKALGT